MINVLKCIIIPSLTISEVRVHVLVVGIESLVLVKRRIIFFLRKHVDCPKLVEPYFEAVKTKSGP